MQKNCICYRGQHDFDCRLRNVTDLPRMPEESIEDSLSIYVRKILISQEKRWAFLFPIIEHLSSSSSDLDN